MFAGSNCRGNRSKSNHWYYTEPTNYTSIGVSVGGGGGGGGEPQVFNLGWIQKQPVIKHQSSVRHTDEPQSGQKQLSVALQPSLDDWGEAITGCHSIGLCTPHQLRHQYWCSWWVRVIPVDYSSKRICDAHCYDEDIHYAILECTT